MKIFQSLVMAAITSAALFGCGNSSQVEADQDSQDIVGSGAKWFEWRLDSQEKLTDESPLILSSVSGEAWNAIGRQKHFAGCDLTVLVDLNGNDREVPNGEARTELYVDGEKVAEVKKSLAINSSLDPAWDLMHARFVAKTADPRFELRATDAGQRGVQSGGVKIFVEARCDGQEKIVEAGPVKFDTPEATRTLTVPEGCALVDVVGTLRGERVVGEARSRNAGMDVKSGEKLCGRLQVERQNIVRLVAHDGDEWLTTSCTGDRQLLIGRETLVLDKGKLAATTLELGPSKARSPYGGGDWQPYTFPELVGLGLRLFCGR